MEWIRGALPVAVALFVGVAPGVGRAQESSEKGAEASATAGFDEEHGFHVQSADGNYLVGVGLQGGYKLEPVFMDGEAESRTAFSFLRPILRGNLFRPWIRFWTSLEMAEFPIYVLDSYVDVQPIDAFGVRAGQQYTPVSRHESWGPQQILFPEFATIANYFWTGRDKGVTVFGTLEHMEYYAGAYSDSPLRTSQAKPGRYQLNARATFFPMGKPGYGELPYIMSGDKDPPLNVSFTVQGAGGRIEQLHEEFDLSQGVFRVTPEGERRFITGGVDLFVQAHRFSFFGEAYLSRSEPPGGAARYSSFGTWVQADYVLYKKVLDAGVRLSYLDPSFDLDHDRLVIGEAQLAWFVNAPHLVVKLRYQVAHQEAPDPTASAGVLLARDPGTSHLITLQLNIAF